LFGWSCALSRHAAHKGCASYYTVGRTQSQAGHNSKNKLLLSSLDTKGDEDWERTVQHARKSNSVSQYPLIHINYGSDEAIWIEAGGGVD
jgi:hypothetical protein